MGTKPLKKFSNVQSLKFSSLNNAEEKARVIEMLNFYGYKKREHKDITNQELFEKLYSTEDSKERAKIKNIICEKNIGLLISAINMFSQQDCFNTEFASEMSYTFANCINLYNPSCGATFSTYFYKAISKTNAKYYHNINRNSNFDANVLYYDDIPNVINTNYGFEIDNEEFAFSQLYCTPADKLTKKESEEHAKAILESIFNNCLTPEQKLVFSKRIGFYDNPQILKEIGEELGVSRQAIFATFKKAIKNINKYLNANPTMKEEFQNSLKTIAEIGDKELIDQEKSL